MPSSQNASDPLFELIAALAGAGVKFVICGGVACVLHGVERATYDLDIAVDFSPENVDTLLQIARDFGLEPRIPEPAERLKSADHRKKWIEEKGALVYTFVSKDGPLQLDVFLTYPKDWPDLSANAVVIDVDSVMLPVSSIEHLLEVKRAIQPARQKDLLDIAELERIQQERK